jgi:hypothetical protein
MLKKVLAKVKKLVKNRKNRLISSPSARLNVASNLLKKPVPHTSQAANRILRTCAGFLFSSIIDCSFSTHCCS